MKKLLMIASAYTELSVSVKSLPKGNEEFAFEQKDRKPGGCGFSFACFFEKIGFPYDLFCDPGTGIYGDYIREEMAKRNIAVLSGSDETGGCVLHLKDEDGNEGAFLVEGNESVFHSEWLYDLFPEEYSAAAVSAEMLAGEGADELADALYELELPVWFVCTERAQEIDPDIFSAVCGCHPVLIIPDSDAYELSGRISTEIDGIAKKLYEDTDAPVILLMKESGAYCYDGRQSWIAPGKISHADLWSAAFLAAMTAGVDWKNGMMFANEYGSRPLDEESAQAAGKRIAGMILHR